MGTTIFLKSSDLQVNGISKGIKKLNQAQSPIIEASNTMANIIRDHNGVYFMWQASEEAGSISAEVDRIVENLESLKVICNSASEEIEDADKSFRGWSSKNYCPVSDGKKRSLLDALGITWLLRTVFGIDISQDEATTVSPIYDPTQPVAPEPTPPAKKLDDIHDYEQGVERGTIRYCNQNPDFYSSNGWDENYAVSCKDHCNRASESMAFSYIGIDVSPVDMEYSPFNWYEFAAMGVRTGESYELPTGDGGTATVEIAGTNGFNRGVLDKCVSDFENDNGKGSVSPVMLHYSGSAGHWIDIIGKNEDGSYMAIGPWSSTGSDGERIPFKVYIDDAGVVSGAGFSHSDMGLCVSHIGQYIRRD